MPHSEPAPNFKITCAVDHFTKSIDGKTKRYVRGRASGTNLDLETERMAQSAILAFKKAIQEGIFLPDGRWSLIPLQKGHRTDWVGDTIGWLVDAEIDANFDLYITAELDDDNPDAELLWRKLTRKPEEGRAVKIGLSVGGMVVSAGQEWDDQLQTYVRVYYEVALKEVSVVSQPANPTTFLVAMAKSVDWSKVRGRTVLVEESMEDDIITTIEAESTEKSVESVIAADAAASEEPTVEKTDETVEETEVEKTETVDEATEESVEKTAEAADALGEEPVGEEVSKETDPALDALQAQVADVIKQLADLAHAVSGLMTKANASEESEVEVEKAADSGEGEQVVTDAPAEVVERAVETKAEEESVEKAVVAAPVAEIAEIIKSALTQALKPLEERIEELENEPIDKSFAVNTAKTDGESRESLIEAYEREIELADGKDAVRIALGTMRK